uniref:Uncharacterized protein n=1 Tax=Trichinella nativa TaxID=6335 RepID=A0A0V1KH55_9BILA
MPGVVVGASNISTSEEEVFGGLNMVGFVSWG